MIITAMHNEGVLRPRFPPFPKMQLSLEVSVCETIAGSGGTGEVGSSKKKWCSSGIQGHLRDEDCNDKDIPTILYNKLNYTRILIGSQL